MDPHSPKLYKPFLLTAAACIIVIGAGVLGMTRMAASKRPPTHKPEPAPGLSVSVIPVDTQTISLSASGYGQAAPVNVMDICPQVSGNIVEKHSALDQGGMVEKGAVLLRIDPTDYAITADKAGTQVKLAKNAIAQYRVSFDRDNGRLVAVQKNTNLAKAEYLRLKTLYELSRVGTLSSVETAEQSYNSLLDTQKTLEKTISLYPLQISEAQNDLAQDRADLKTAELNLARCVITAPFSGRVRTESVELGTYITAGTCALTLADDQIFEIQVPLSDKDAFEILGLGKTSGDVGWFSGLAGVGCRIETVTGNSSAAMSGIVNRAVQYDAASRTLYLAVRVSVALEGNNGIPLLDGMFCKVYFQGRSVDNAVKVPLSALNADDTVYLSREGRLKTLDVVRIMANKDHVYVTGGFESNDSLITTSLTSPVENCSLTYVTTPKSEQVAMAGGGIQ